MCLRMQKWGNGLDLRLFGFGGPGRLGGSGEIDTRRVALEPGQMVQPERGLARLAVGGQ